MPNHCSNKLVIKGDVVKFKKDCIRANTDKDLWDKLTFDFNTIVPCPESMYKVTHSLEQLEKNKLKDLAMIQLAKENMDKYGFSYWFDFCREKMGKQVGSI
jgi:hypothetical protein